MTTDDIIRIARKWGVWNGQTVEFNDVGLERFAKLVYEKAWADAALAATHTVTDAAILKEREACAKIVETYETASIRHESPSTAMIFNHCAKAIRARSNL